MSIYTIYLITNQVNNKKYVGYTSKDPKTRWNQHTKIAEKESNYCFKAIHHAIKKYGSDNFKFEIIEQCTDKVYSLNILEPLYIKKYDTFGKNGYNLTMGI